jgi:hypothetical protein
MPRIPRDRKRRPDALTVKQVYDMVRRPLNNPYTAMTVNRPVLSDFFAGKEFSIYVDGVPEIKFKVKDINTLYWWKNGVDTGWEEEYYECYESSSKGLYFLFHQVKNDLSCKLRILAVDTASRLVTLVSGVIGLVDYTPRDTDATPFFGYIDWYDGSEPPKERHKHTLELIQKNILWKVNNWCQIHYYTSRHYFSYQLLGKENGLVVSERARHIKLRENVYLFYWRDMQGDGILSCEIMDLNSFCSIGVNYGLTDYQFICSGFSRESGRFITDGELAEYERIFEETKDQKHALKTVFGIDIDETTTPVLDC